MRQPCTGVPASPVPSLEVPSGSSTRPRIQPPSSGLSSIGSIGAPALAGSFTFGSSGRYE